MKTKGTISFLAALILILNTTIPDQPLRRRLQPPIEN